MNDKDLTQGQPTILHIGVFHYPGALRSAVYGFEELFMLANRVCNEQGLSKRFKLTVFEDTHQTDSENEEPLHIVLLPPALDDGYYLNPPSADILWLENLHQNGCLIATACAGAFIVAGSNIVNNRAITTHWGLAVKLKSTYPNTKLDAAKILIDHGDLITAGGMMSWLDLGLELVSKYASASVMRQVGKMLVVDTAAREQRFYQQFVPDLSHSDSAILASQQWLNQHFDQAITVKGLAAQAHMTERTFQRRFMRATQLSPNQYIQRLRVQKACDLLEGSASSFDSISHLVGYEDASACRKVFVKVMGLTPREFRQRFRNDATMV